MILILCVLIVFRVSVSQSCKRHVFQFFPTMASKEENALWWLRFQRIICRFSKCCTSLILAAQYPYMDIVVQSMYSVQFRLLKSLTSSVTVLEKNTTRTRRRNAGLGPGVHLAKDFRQVRMVEIDGWFRFVMGMYLVLRWYFCWIYHIMACILYIAHQL